MNLSFAGYFAAGANFVQANTNQPFRFGNMSMTSAQTLLRMYGLEDAVSGLAPAQSFNYPSGYLVNANINSQQYLFFLPPHFDQGILELGEATKQPVTPGELLTLTSLPMVNAFAGPVLVLTGSKSPPSRCSLDRRIPTETSDKAATFPIVEATALRLATPQSLQFLAPCQQTSQKSPPATSPPTSSRIQDTA